MLILRDEHLALVVPKTSKRVCRVGLGVLTLNFDINSESEWSVLVSLFSKSLNGSLLLYVYDFLKF